MQVDETTLSITELPIRKWTQDYKEFLEGMVKPDKDAKDQTQFVQDYKEYHTDTSVNFQVTLTEVRAASPGATRVANAGNRKQLGVMFAPKLIYVSYQTLALSSKKHVFLLCKSNLNSFFLLYMYSCLK